MGGKTLITPIGIRITNKERAELKKLATTLGIPFNTAVVEAIRLYVEHHQNRENLQDNSAPHANLNLMEK
jgi:hypothetical protein